MIEAQAITGDKLFSATEDNKILAVLHAGEDPQWTGITNAFIDDNSIDTRNLVDNAVISRKIADLAITASKIAPEEMINTIHIIDRAVTNRKLDKNAVSNEKIVDHTIQGDKIARNTVIPAYTTVEEHSDYERRSIRNTVLSPNAPRDGKNGDLWFRFV
jgi:hypothetical protein